MSNGDGDVAIIGGGITGWILARTLSTNGVTCRVYDTNPCSSFSSTRNQGWLHSGAFFVAVNDDPGVVEACRDGANWLTAFAPQAVKHTVPCYYLFETDAERNRVVVECGNLGVQANAVDSQTIATLEPMLRNVSPKTQYAAEMYDRPMDTTALLQKLIGDSCSCGVRFQSVQRVDDLNVSWSNDHWEIDLGGSLQASFNAVVLTCGPYIPVMLESILPSQATRMRVTKVPVLVIKDLSVQALVAIPGQVGAPQVVPFDNPQGRGVTVCLHRTDEQATEANDYGFPPLHREDFQDALDRWLAGIVNVMHASNRLDLPAHMYLCHKLDISIPGVPPTRAHFERAFSPEPGAPMNLLALYPGKFTAAPVAASQCAQTIMHLLARTPTRTTQPATIPPNVSVQPYFDPSMYRQFRLREQQNHLLLDKDVPINVSMRSGDRAVLEPIMD